MILCGLVLFRLVLAGICPTRQVEQILEKPSADIGPQDVNKLIACIEEINVPAQEHIKAQAWSALVDLVESNQEKFDLAAECYAKLNTLGPDQLVGTTAHETMQQFATLVSALAAHQMLSVAAF